MAPRTSTQRDWAAAVRSVFGQPARSPVLAMASWGMVAVSLAAVAYVSWALPPAPDMTAGRDITDAIATGSIPVAVPRAIGTSEFSERDAVASPRAGVGVFNDRWAASIDALTLDMGDLNRRLSTWQAQVLSLADRVAAVERSISGLDGRLRQLKAERLAPATPAAVVSDQGVAPGGPAVHAPLASAPQANGVASREPVPGVAPIAVSRAPVGTETPSGPGSGPQPPDGAPAVGARSAADGEAQRPDPLTNAVGGQAAARAPAAVAAGLVRLAGSAAALGNPPASAVASLPVDTPLMIGSTDGAGAAPPDVAVPFQVARGFPIPRPAPPRPTLVVQAESSPTVAAPAGPEAVDPIVTGSVPATSVAADALVERSRFGIDLGGYRTLPDARAAWIALMGRNVGAADGLEPIVRIEEAADGTMELRLVAGPFGNAVDAIRQCARMKLAGASCIPALFVGQPLALQ